MLLSVRHENNNLKLRMVGPAMLPRFISKDWHQMVGYVARLNRVPRDPTRLQQTTLHRMQFHGITDAIERTPRIGISTVTT